MRYAAALAVSVAAAALAAPSSTHAKSPTGKALDARVEQLDAQLRGLRDQSREVSGTGAPRDGRKQLEFELAELRVRQDRLDEVIADAEGNAEDLAAFKKKFEDRSIFTAGDAAQEGGEKAAEVAARKKLLGKGAGRVLGWLGLAGDVGEYGGKWLLKQGDLDALEDAVETSRVNLHDLYEAHIGLSQQIDDRLARIEKMKKIIEENDALYSEYVELKAKQKAESTPATKGAVLRRVDDAEGDAEERKKYHSEAAQRGIQAVTKPSVPQQKGGMKQPARPPTSRY